MKKNKQEDKVFRSIADFEKEYFPNSYKKKTKEGMMNAHAIGINLAKESLANIKRQ